LQPFLSLVIPALNEEDRLPLSLRQAVAFLEMQSYTSELLVIDNGSTDRTAEIVRDFVRRHDFLRLLHEPRRGKGAAVRTGMLAARGEFRFIADADFSMPVGELNRFLPPALTGFDIAIASREAPGAVRYGEPAHRHWIGRAFNLLVRLLAVPGFQDTQCGFKCFRGETAEDLFRVQRLEGWTFDVEVLHVAQHRGLRIVEVPIPWTYNAGSRVRVLRDSVMMLSDLIRIRRNGRRGYYAPLPPRDAAA
jgi:glycosyltransferase involved in cell wall biosynthesis